MENNNLKNDLLDELDRHLEWIRSCDTKASIVLAMLGVFIVTISSEIFLDSQKEIVLKVLNNINFSNLIYFIFEVLVYLLFFNGIYNIIRVLFPQLKNLLRLIMGWKMIPSIILKVFQARLILSIKSKGSIEHQKKKLMIFYPRFI